MWAGDWHGGGTTAAIVPSEPSLDSVNQLVLQPSFGCIPRTIDKPARYQGPQRAIRLALNIFPIADPFL
jgi:hypothetical protein